MSLTLTEQKKKISNTTFLIGQRLMKLSDLTQLDLIEVANILSKKRRWNGNGTLNVLTHSFLAFCVSEDDASEVDYGINPWLLFHDFQEAFTNDTPSPFKTKHQDNLETYILNTHILPLIDEKCLGVWQGWEAELKEIDRECALAEVMSDNLVPTSKTLRYSDGWTEYLSLFGNTETVTTKCLAIHYTVNDEIERDSSFLHRLDTAVLNFYHNILSTSTLLEYNSVRTEANAIMADFGLTPD